MISESEESGVGKNVGLVGLVGGLADLAFGGFPGGYMGWFRGVLGAGTLVCGGSVAGWDLIMSSTITRPLARVVLSPGRTFGCMRANRSRFFFMQWKITKTKLISMAHTMKPNSAPIKNFGPSGWDTASAG